MSFSKFRAANDIDPFNFEGSDEEFEVAGEAHEEAITALLATPEAEARVTADLEEVLARNLEPQLKRELLRRGEIDINTVVFL